MKCVVSSRLLSTKQNNFAELVCSILSVGMLLQMLSGFSKEEMRRLGSVILESAEATRVPAGGALAVDRDGFSQMVTEKLPTTLD